MTAAPRIMYDCISANASALVPWQPQMLAIYLTGSSDIRWTAQHVALFPHVETWVRIDQAGVTAPQHAANVMDVEPGCYSPADVPSWTSQCTAPRPTVYCDRVQLDDVMKVWKGDIWLAAPGMSLSECQGIVKANHQIVAIQNDFARSFDRSLIFDPNWPLKASPPPATKSVTVEYYKPGFGWVNGWVTEPLTIPDNSPRVRVRVDNGSWVTVE